MGGCPEGRGEQRGEKDLNIPWREKWVFLHGELERGGITTKEVESIDLKRIKGAFNVEGG